MYLVTKERALAQARALSGALALAERAGCLDEVARVTDEAMNGEIDFAESLARRVALLKGLDATALDSVYDDLVFTPGAAPSCAP